MVNNSNYIFDEGENKFVGEYKMSVPKWFRDFDRKVFDCRMKEMEYERYCELYRNRDSIHGSWLQFENQEQVDKYHKLNNEINELKKDEFLWPKRYANLKWKANSYKDIAEYMGHIPYNPCVMFNISPNWKDKASPMVDVYRQLLDRTICNYLSSCNRYSRWKYCLESGGEGNFLHAHIVAEINPKVAKSVKTHINKGNHTREIMKQWDNVLKDLNLDYNSFRSGKEKGIEGLLKGKYSIQRILINNEDMFKDKINYLYEDKKPEGHKNKYDLKWIRGEL